ncbi:MAG TPA: hypothetical protein VFA68_07565 [Terriglobales bacterium]|nr:hypothetical protein [Terriglobales bacterium]
MNYLQATEYESYGLEATTPAALVTGASAIIDAHCRRATLGVAQYEEHIRITRDRNTIRVSYTPLATIPPATTPIVSARGRYALPRRGEWPLDELSCEVATMFGLPGTWTDIDASTIGVYADTGELTLPINAVGLGFSELEIIYTAGLEFLPDAVKVACAQVVRNAQSTPALNVRAGNLDRMHLEYFSDSLVDSNVRALLAPYVTQKVG